MRTLTALADAWRKNGPEILGLCTGALPRFVTARRPRAHLGGVPVFSYHLVEPLELDSDLEFLAANGYSTLGTRELLEHLSGAGEPLQRAVMLTFDDGPRNFFDVAFPLLRRYGARAVAFIAPGLHADTERDADARPMTWQEIGAIHACGLVEFQSHTFESRSAARWPAPVPLAGCDPALERRRRGAPRTWAEDLALSRREIESRLAGAQVDQVAFPMYVGTPAAVEVARRLGFRACYWGLLAGRALNRPGDSPFHISRLSGEFVQRLPGAGRASLRSLLHRRMRLIQRARAWRRRFEPLHS